MGTQLKTILSAVAATAVVGVAGLALYYDLKAPPPAPEVASTPESAAPAAPLAPAAEPEAQAAIAGVPTFDIVRVEPGGEVVAAGRSANGARVELMLGDGLMSTADANDTGEWAMVLDKPLAPGSYELVLRASGEDGEGAMVEGDRVTVVIEAPEKTPLVAVTRPGEPTEVLQAPQETVVAAAPAATQPPAEGQAQGVAQPAAQAPSAEPAAPGSQETAIATAPVAGEPQAAAPAGQAASQPSAPPAALTAPVSIETVEVEDPGRLMLSGRAGAGEAVRLYLNNEQLGDAHVGADGRWALSSDRPMPPGRYEVRADVVAADGGVRGRAEVRFDRVMLVAEGEEPPAAAGGAPAPGAEAGAATVDGGVRIVSRASGGGTSEGGDTVGAGAGTSVVVIARGDNLWRIARKIYGRGVRHTVIYEANRNQIRNPHLIYPGQVFTIPVLEDEANPKG